MAESVAKNYNVYTDVRTIVACGLAELGDINCEADQSKRFKRVYELTQELDRMWEPYMSLEVRVTGDRIVTAGQDAENGATDTEGASVVVLDETSIAQPDARNGRTVEGRTVGFGYRKVPIMFDGEELGSRYVLCYMVDLGCSEVTIPEDADVMALEQKIAYFDISCSRLRFLETGLVHDMSELRGSEDEMYETVDAIIYDEALSLSEKLQALHQLFTDADFELLPDDKQAEVLSYVNGCELFTAPRVLTAGYAILAKPSQIGEADVEDSILFLGSEPVQAVPHGFMKSSHYIFDDSSDNQQPAVYMGDGVSMTMSIFFGDKRHVVWVPLNQAIEITEVDPVAVRGTQALAKSALKNS